MSECGRVDRIERGLVQVGLQDAFLEVVEDDVVGGPAEVGPGLLVQLSPDLLAGFPDHAAEATPRVAQRGHEQAGFAPALGARHPRGGAFTVVDLHLLAGRKAQTIKLLGLLVAKLGAEPFDRVVGAVKAVQVDQVLVDGGGVAAQAQLGVDEGAVGFALGGGQRRRYRPGSRWPGWSSLTGKVGGHPGAVCRIGGEALLVGPDGVARNAGDAFDLALGGAALEQRPDGGLQMWLQDVHSVVPSLRGGGN
ncbi:hypothetical protein VPARA_68490 [Variovorax paradoxus]|uniref:Uncharacterized protein n=1 Tax=Variovorax paradoxus TaxID=34073 RepID=A0A0H2LNY8_VARPD|nr:hypothetical protein VPARA_68490 [Variovorax paradoxus]